MSDATANTPAPLDDFSPEAKAEMRRWVERWKLVNRATRRAAQGMTDDDVRRALDIVLEGFWDRRGPSDDGEGLIVFQQILRAIRQRKATHATR